jgi:LysM repeat protein
MHEKDKIQRSFINPSSCLKTKNTVSEIAKTYPEKHTVLPKETLYGIAKQYGYVEDLNKINPTLQKSD